MKNKLKKIVLPLSVIGMLAIGSTSVFASEVNKNDNSNIETFVASHDFSSFPISKDTNFGTSLELTSSQKYGKAKYYNNSSYDATLYVEGQPLKTIKPYSGGYIEWKKGLLKNEYKVTLTATKGELNGTFSLAKAHELSDFQDED